MPRITWWNFCWCTAKSDLFAFRKSHLWKEKLVLVWAHTWRKQRDCLYPSLEQSIGKKVLFHWFGFCHLEPLLLMTSERDSWYVCFLGQLLYWLPFHPKTVGFMLLLSELHDSWLHHLLQQHQLICNEVLNHPKTDQIFAVVQCEAWHRDCLFHNVLYSSPHIHWIDAVLLLIPLHNELPHIFAWSQPINHVYSVIPLPRVNPPLFFLLLIMSCAITKSDQRPAQNWSLRRIEWKPLQNCLRSHGWSICRFNIICKYNLALLA